MFDGRDQTLRDYIGPTLMKCVFIALRLAFSSRR